MSTAFETLITQMTVEERIAAIHRLTDSLRPMAQGPMAQGPKAQGPVAPAPTLYRCDAMPASDDSDDVSVITVANSVIHVDVASVDASVILIEEPDNSVEVLEPIRVPVSPVPYDSDLGSMNCQQLRDAWALLVGKPLGLKHSGKLSTKLLLKNEIMRLRTEQTMKKMAQYDLFESAPRTLAHPSPVTPKPRRKLKNL